MFKLHKGRVKTIYLPVTASTAIAEGALVAYSSGKLIAATATTAVADIAGVLVKAITSSDSDYATDSRLVGVQVPLDDNVEWEFKTANLVVGDIGKHADISDSVTVNRAATTYKVVHILRVLSSTKGIGRINFGKPFTL